MGGLLLILTVMGAWLTAATIMDWDWSLGTFDQTPAENAVGAEAIRWGICVFGIGMFAVGMGGCTP